MLIPFLVSKIHRAVVTRTDLNYEGSIAIDEEILRKAGLKIYQKVEIYNIANGNRFGTYVLPVAKGSGEFIVNGAAARLVAPGDVIIIAAYALIDERELGTLETVILNMNEKNEITRICHEKV